MAGSIPLRYAMLWIAQFSLSRGGTRFFYYVTVYTLQLACQPVFGALLSFPLAGAAPRGRRMQACITESWPGRLNIQADSACRGVAGCGPVCGNILLVNRPADNNFRPYHNARQMLPAPMPYIMGLVGHARMAASCSWLILVLNKKVLLG